MPIDEQTLESFLSGNISVLDEIIGTDASELKNILNSATISGMQTSEILNQVSVASSASGQRAILNTRLNTYSRVATNTMMKDAPSDTKYVYVGPIDERTRDECLEYASAGPLTEAQIIESGWSASLVDGGGINCRHKWEIASDEGIKLFEGKQAQQVIQNKTKGINPLSKRMAGKHTDYNDAVKWAETNVANEVKFGKKPIPIENLNSINKLTLETINKYNLDKLDLIGLDTLVDKRRAGIPAFLVRTHLRNKDTGKLEKANIMAFNRKSMLENKAYSSLVKKQFELTGKKWQVTHMEFEGIIRHEIGHHLYYQKNMHNKWQSELKKAYPERKLYIQEARQVSQYGASQPSELFAEVHSAVMSGLESEIPLKIMRIYNKMIDEI